MNLSEIKCSCRADDGSCLTDFGKWRKCSPDICPMKLMSKRTGESWTMIKKEFDERIGKWEEVSAESNFKIKEWINGGK